MNNKENENENILNMLSNQVFLINNKNKSLSNIKHLNLYYRPSSKKKK